MGTIYMPKRVFPAKDVPFGGLHNIRLHLGSQTPKKPHHITEFIFFSNNTVVPDK